MNELNLYSNLDFLTVDETMNLIIGKNPKHYKFVFGSEKNLPKDAALIYRALVEDIKTFSLSLYFDGIEACEENIGQFVSFEEYHFSNWWFFGKLKVTDIKGWLIKNEIGSDFFEVYSHNTQDSTSPNQGMWLPENWITEKPPEQEFCIYPLAPIGAVTLMNAHGGTGKSLLALKMAMHIAIGKDILGASTNREKVAYLSLEDPSEILRSRIYRIMRDMIKNDFNCIDNIKERLMIIDRYGIPTLIAERKDENIRDTETTISLIDQLLTYNIKCLFVDTLIRTHNLNENNNAHMGTLLAKYEKIAKEAGCAVILLHHLPKGNENKAYAARGASAITDNARSSMLLDKVSIRSASALKDDSMLEAATEKRLIKVTHTKHNYSKQHPDQYFEISEDGTPKEIIPKADETAIIKRRYSELYHWYSTKWRKELIVEDNIKSHYQSFRPSKGIGHRRYFVALRWAIENGYAEKVKAPKGESKNPRAEYFKLKPIKM